MEINYLEGNFDELTQHLQTIPDGISKINYIEGVIEKYIYAQTLTIEQLGSIEMYEALEPTITDPEFLQKCNNLLQQILDNRFVLQNSNLPGSYILTDTHYLICITWQHKRFNDTQSVTIINSNLSPDPTLLARIMREMANYLIKNHPHII